MKRKITSEESELVFNYVRKRTLTRPSITYKKAIQITLVFFCITIICSITIYFLLFSLGLNIPILLFLLIFYLVVFLFVAKKMSIGIIQLYQHYAPDSIRRKCMLMPTCSEYGIIVLNKYGFFIGWFKIFRRLFFTCKSSVYFIDAP